MVLRIMSESLRVFKIEILQSNFITQHYTSDLSNNVICSVNIDSDADETYEQFTQDSSNEKLL